jgi:hypothetical protein
MMKSHRSSLVIVILALIGGTTGCGTVTPVPTSTSTLIPIKTLHPTATYSPTVEPSPTVTIPPLPIETVNPAIRLEVIAYTWDWPMMANIPAIHIWKDGYALWVTYGQDNLYHVFETTLSHEEMLRVQEVLLKSRFWEMALPEAKFTNASWLFVWANDGDREGVVPTPLFDNIEVTDLLKGILASSVNKKEYFPLSGYLFVTDKIDNYNGDWAYLWPDDEVQFDFEVSTQGVYVEGKIISTVWNAVQQGAFQVASGNIT